MINEMEINSLRELINYSWKDEKRDFEETFEVELPASYCNVDIEKEIEVYGKDDAMKNHAFFHLLVLTAFLDKVT